MRILFPYLARWGSANRTRYHHLLGALTRRGHEVTVLQPPPLVGAEETNFIEMPVPTIPRLRVEDLHLPGGVWRRRFPLEKLTKKGMAAVAARADVLRRCARGDVDVLLLYHIAHAPLARARAGLIVMDVADDLLAMLDAEVPRVLRPLVRPVAERLFRGLLSAARLVTTASGTLADRLGDVALIPNGVDREAISASDGRVIRARHAAPIIGYVGAFEYFMDVDFVLEVAARLPECTFLLVGGGRLLSETRQRARTLNLRNVHFPGPVPYPEALDYMAALDVALLPFRRGRVADAFSPLKLFEYLALGRPVFTTPMAEVHRIAGAWVGEGGTADACLEFIRAALRRDDEVMRRTAAGCAAVLEHYEWEGITSRLEARLEDALRR